MATMACPACAETVEAVDGPCPFCREPLHLPKLAVDRRCPFCAEPIKPQARKCPHCRTMFDQAPKSAPPAAGETYEAVRRILGESDVHEKLMHSFIAGAIGSVLFCALGILLGPACLGYAIHYRNRLEELKLPTPWTLTGLYIVSAFWFVGGIAFIIMVVAAGNR